MTQKELLDEGYEKALTFDGYSVMQKQSCFQYGYAAGAKAREKRIVELEAQIEKMKCCENCKHHRFIGDVLECKNNKNCVDNEYWEIIK